MVVQHGRGRPSASAKAIALGSAAVLGRISPPTDVRPASIMHPATESLPVEGGQEWPRSLQRAAESNRRPVHPSRLLSSSFSAIHSNPICPVAGEIWVKRRQACALTNASRFTGRIAGAPQFERMNSKRQRSRTIWSNLRLQRRSTTMVVRQVCHFGIDCPTVFRCRCVREVEVLESQPEARAPVDHRSRTETRWNRWHLDRRGRVRGIDR